MVMDDNKENIMPEGGEEAFDEKVVDESIDEAVDPSEEPVEENEADKKLAELEAKSAEYVDKYQRLMAEFYNFRERTSKEKAGMYDDGVRETIEKLLPVVDNLERAVEYKKKNSTAETESFIKGFEMILKQFKETLKGMGVEEIPALGEKFDPKLHSAVSHIEDESFEENTISIEMLKGYTHKGKVIRHSMVQVAN